jgi:hypothetical protein
MDYGVKLYQDKNYEAAIAEFQAAYKVRPKASPLVNISLCYKGQFNYLKAIAALETALAKHSDTMSDADKKAATDAIAEMRGLLGYVTVDVAPPTAVVTLDGEDQPAGVTAKPIPLGPGSHRISARAEGYATASQAFTVASGEKDKKLTLALTPDKGWVAVKTNDAETAIAIDGKPLGYGTWAGFLAPGSHLVQMYKAGVSGGESRQIVVAVGKSQEVRPGFGGISVAPSQNVGPDIPPPPPKKPEKIEPPMRGFYGLVTGGLLAPLAHPQYFPAGEAQSGAVVGLRPGYRVNNAAAFEAMFEYGNVTVDSKVYSDSSYSLSSYRFGLNLRLMTPGRSVRFVGTLGGGLTNDVLEYDLNDAKAGTNVCPAELCKETNGLDPYFLSELGLELEFGGVLVGAALQSYFQAMKGLDKVAYDNDPLVWFGAGLRIGYGTW